MPGVPAQLLLQAVSRRRWRLATVDSCASLSPASDYVEAQYEQEELQYAFTTEMVSSAGAGDSEKGTGPGAIGPDSLTFEATWQAEYATDDVGPIGDMLEKLRRHVPELNRPPLLLFTWGPCRMSCWLSSLTVKYVGGLSVFGKRQRLVANITLTKEHERPLSDARQGEQPSTVYHVLMAGEGPEHLALAHLGDPTLGPLIRRDFENRDLEWVVGETVRVLPKTNSAMRGPPKPVAVPFTGDWEETFEALAALRAEVSP